MIGPVLCDSVEIPSGGQDDQEDNQRSQCPGYGQDRVDLMLAEG